MAVDIDSLQIEIEATSSDAASKIDQLATALTNLKSAAKGGAGLTTTTKQLQALSNAAKLINGTNLNSQKIQQFASAMNSLSAIQKASGLNSTINALKKLPEISTALDKADLGKFAQQMNQVASAMRPLATEMQKVANGFSAFPIRIQKIIQSNSALAASNNKTAKSFGVLGTGISSASAKFSIYYLAFRRIASVASNWVKESNDYVENLNLFTVAMGEYAESAKAYAEEVQSVMGIDSSEWMRNQGVFMQMASGFGVVAENAAFMSKNLTQLGYDISSFYNIPIEEAMQKLQSGIAGEIEPLRRLGYAIDQASLEQVALNHGITDSVLSMSQAEKSQLRYIAIMEQSTNAMGDMSRTIQTPANALRILNQQITQLSRALGNMLIPILQQVIPWVQAFVEIMTEAAQAIANLLGFTLPTIDYSGLEGVSTGASGASDALDEAADSAKKLQHYVLGIDELNIISPQQNTAADTGLEGIGGDLGLELPGYDFLNGLESQLDDLKDRLKEILYDYVIPIGAALAAWKILNLLSSLGAAAGIISNLKKAVAGTIVAYLEFKLAKGSFDDFLSDDGSIWDFVKGAVVTALGTGVLYAILGKAGLIIGLSVGLVASLTSLTTAIGNGLDYNGFKADLMKSFAIMLGGAIGLVIGGPAGALVGLTIAAGATFMLTSIAAHVSGQLKSGSAESTLTKLVASVFAGLPYVSYGPGGFVIAFGVSLALQEFGIEFGKWYQETSRIIDGIEVLDETISDTTKNAVQPFLDQMRTLDDTFAYLEFSGTIIDDSVITDVQSKVDEIVDTITNGLDSSKNKSLGNLSTLTDYMDKDVYADILQANTDYYEKAKSELQGYQSEIKSILKTSLDENGRVTEEGWRQIAEIQTEMQGLGLSNLSETQIEYETIMRNLRDNTAHISLEQASEIIKNAKATRDETVAAAENQYSAVLLEAQKMLETGAISSDQYYKITQAADQAKNETIAKAEEQYSTIYNTAYEKLGELSRYIDENSGEIKSKWTVFWEDAQTIFSEGWNNVVTFFTESLPNWWNETIAPWFSLEQWLGLASNIGTAIKTAWTDAVTQWRIDIQNWWDEDIAPWFTAEKWLGLGKQALDGLLEGFGDFFGVGEGLGSALIGGVRSQNALNSHSPSVAFEEIGQDASEGFAIGFGDLSTVVETVKTALNTMHISANTLSSQIRLMIDSTLADFLDSISLAQTENQRFTNALTLMYRQMASKSVNAIQSIISYLNAIPRRITTVHTIVTVHETVNSSGPGSGTAVSSFASGGYPDMGQMFIARESGPELVGNIGRRTVVANNEQIVEGITAGVAEANMSQNALLREQNDLLRAILAKEGVTYISDKQIKKAYDRASRNSGVTIMAGGVVG